MISNIFESSVVGQWVFNLKWKLRVFKHTAARWKMHLKNPTGVVPGESSQKDNVILKLWFHQKHQKLHAEIIFIILLKACRVSRNVKLYLKVLDNIWSSCLIWHQRHCSLFRVVNGPMTGFGFCLFLWRFNLCLWVLFSLIQFFENTLCLFQHITKFLISIVNIINKNKAF